MIIKYIHWSEPEKEKTHDTVKVLKNNPFITKSQEEFDAFTLEHFIKDKERGIVLSYEIIEK